MLDTKCDPMNHQGTEIDIKVKTKRHFNYCDGTYMKTYKYDRSAGAGKAPGSPLQRELPPQKSIPNPGRAASNLLRNSTTPRYTPRYSYQRPSDISERLQRYDQNIRKPPSAKRSNVKPKKSPCQQKTPASPKEDYEKDETAVRMYSDQENFDMDKFLNVKMQGVSEKTSTPVFDSTVVEPGTSSTRLFTLAKMDSSTFETSSNISFRNCPHDDTEVMPNTQFEKSQVTQNLLTDQCSDLSIDITENSMQNSNKKLQCQIMYLLANTPLQPTPNEKDRVLRKKVLKQIYHKLKKMSLVKHCSKSEEDFMKNIKTHLSSGMRKINNQHSTRKRFFNRNKVVTCVSRCSQRSESQEIKSKLEKIILIWFNSLNMKDVCQETHNDVFNSFVDRVQNISENLLKLNIEYKNCLKEQIIDYLHEIPLITSDRDYIGQEANRLLLDILTYYNFADQSNNCKFIICFINNSQCSTSPSKESVKNIIKCDLNDYLSEHNITQKADNIDEVKQSVTHIILNSIKTISSGSDKDIFEKIQKALLGSQIFSTSQTVKLSQMILKHVKDDMTTIVPKRLLPSHTPSTNFKPLDACLIFRETDYDKGMCKKWWQSNDKKKNATNNYEIMNISFETKDMVNVIKEWLKKCQIFISYKSKYKRAIKNFAEDIIYRQKYLALHKISPNTENELEYLKFQIFKSLHFIFEQKDNDYACELMNGILKSNTYKNIEAISNPGDVMVEILNINNDEPPQITNIEQNKQDLDLDKEPHNSFSKNLTDPSPEINFGDEVINQSIQRISQVNCEKLSRLVNENHKSDSLNEINDNKNSIEHNNSLLNGSRHGSKSNNELEVFQLCHLSQRTSGCRKEVNCVQVVSVESSHLSIFKTPQQINDELVKFIKDWCEEIPIDVKNSKEKSAAKTAKIVIQIGVGKQIVKIRADPLAMQDRYLCEAILEEEVDDLLDCLPQSPNLLKTRDAMKYKLVNYVVHSNEQLLEAYMILNNQYQLHQAPLPVTNPGQTIANVKEKLNDINFIDDYIKQTYVENDTNIQLLYKDRLTEEVRRILGEHNDSGDKKNDQQLEQEICKRLDNISIPTEQSYRKFEQELLIKMELDEWIKTWPIKSAITPEKKHSLDEHLHKLSLKLATYIENKQDDFDKNISQEISNFFLTLPFRCELPINWEMTISDLIYRLKNNELFWNSNTITDDRLKSKSSRVILKRIALKKNALSDLKKTYTPSTRLSITNHAELCYLCSKECQSKISVKDRIQNTRSQSLEANVNKVKTVYQGVGSKAKEKINKLTSSDALLNYAMTWRHLASSPYQFAMLSIYLVTKISKLHQDPAMLTNDLIYGQIVDSILEEALDLYGKHMSKSEKKAVVSDIHTQMKHVRDLVKSEYEVSKFKQDVISTAHKTIHLHNMSKNKLEPHKQIPEMYVAAENIADELIEMYFDANDPSQQCRKKLIASIDAYVYEMKTNNMIVFFCENLAKKALMKNVLEIPAPNNDALSMEMKEIKLKKLIDVTFNALPIAPPATPADKQHLAIMKCILTKRIQAINADLSLKSEDFYCKANTAIEKTLKNISFRSDEQKEPQDYASQMISKIFETSIFCHPEQFSDKDENKIATDLRAQDKLKKENNADAGSLKQAIIKEDEKKKCQFTNLMANL